MNYRPSYMGETKSEHRVKHDIGVLAAVSVAIVVLIVV